MGALSKLVFVVDIINFHAACKTWRSIGASVSPPPRHLPPPLPDAADPSCPLLFEINSKEPYMKYRLWHPLYNYTWYMEFPAQVKDNLKRIHFSKYGWSLMTRYKDPILFNPLTQEVIKLPDMPFFPGFPNSMFFTAPPSHPDCSVVAISGRFSSVYVHKLRGEDDWKQHDLKGKMDPDFRPICHPILYQGLCYCLDKEGNLGVFDIQDIEKTWIVHKNVIPSRRAKVTALVEHNGQLLVVSVGIHRDRPWIFELDLNRKTRSRVTCLGKNNALFISEGASFSQRAIVCGTGNKVFVPFFKNNTDLYRFYSLATGKYHSFFHNLSTYHLWDMKFFPYSSWLPM